jgi:hypothetical protein
MKKEEFDAIRAEALRLSAKKVNTEFGLVPASIPHLDSLIEGHPVDDEFGREALYSLLLSECSIARNDEIYVYYLEKRCAENRSDVVAIADLGSVLSLMGPSKNESALLAAEKAVRMAKAQNRLIRYCATNLARVALRLDNYDYLMVALCTLVDDAQNSREEDTAFAFDFVSSIDLKRCDVVLLDKYKELA